METVELKPHIFWVGKHDKESGLNCNPYLIIDQNEAVLFDAGSVLDFDAVFENVLSLIPLEKLKYIVLHHQDPDLCSAVPLFEKAGANFQIVTHWRTQTLLKYYGITSNYYMINENDYQLRLNSGRILSFIMTPYLHFPGAFTTFEAQTKTLFSSDLFGAFSLDWTLYAGADYSEKMKTFHEHYMPSNIIIRPVMETFLNMEIEMIAPQHGSIIDKNIQEHIKILRDLECGQLLNSVKHDILESGGYMGLCSIILQRLLVTFGMQDVKDVVSDLEITFDDDLNILDYNYTGNQLWNLLFEQILSKKGLLWLMVIEPLTQKLSKEYDVMMPDVFSGHLQQAEKKAYSLSEENRQLKEINDRLNKSLVETETRLMRCPVTGLYNENFFKTYLTNEINGILEDLSNQNPGIMIISVDQMDKIHFYYGQDEVDGVLKTIRVQLEDFFDQNEILFRLDGYQFAVYIPNSSRENLLKKAENIRNIIANSQKFIEKVTVSIGITTFDEVLKKDVLNPDQEIMRMTFERLRTAQIRGQDIVISSDYDAQSARKSNYILLVDSDQINLDMLSIALQNKNYQVQIAQDGEEALQIAKKIQPLMIISEIMIPKMDGFILREELLANSITKNIPFIFLSYLKTNESVVRATDLKVEHYLKKPFMLSELLGIIQNKLKERV
ncbi:diguanylate cyclase [Eubacteriaceae bacterium ES2]|nr:diguanylate cyclase [Eubacteriaceae bacterium ES2]